MKIAIWPDETWCYVEDLPQLTYMSDDYIVREAGECERCGSQIVPYYDEPFALCDCGTQEWYK